jgi:hypothetical protein
LARWSWPVASGFGVLGLLACTGCSRLAFWRDASGPTYAISLHRLAGAELSASERLTTVVVTPAGTRLRIHTMPLVSSGSFPAISVEPAAGAGPPAVRAQLDDHGRFVWAQASQFAGEPVVVLLDGMYRFTARPLRGQAADGSVLIEGPWDAQEAAQVAAHARANYRCLNRGRRTFGWD